LPIERFIADDAFRRHFASPTFRLLSFFAELRLRHASMMMMPMPMPLR